MTDRGPNARDDDLLNEALWAVEWLTSLIDDRRIADLDDNDKHVDRVDQLRIRLARKADYSA